MLFRRDKIRVQLIVIYYLNDTNYNKLLNFTLQIMTFIGGMAMELMILAKRSLQFFLQLSNQVGFKKLIQNALL